MIVDAVVACLSSPSVNGPRPLSVSTVLTCEVYDLSSSPLVSISTYVRGRRNHVGVVGS
jgi:hypothetical protein